MKPSSSFPDRNQNFWQLTSIQAASQSIPGILTGGILAREYGAGVAISSICIGNLILWLIGLGVISIAAKGRKNAIESVRGFLGKGGSFLMALIMMIAFLSWYMLEIQATTQALAPLFQSDGNWEIGLIGAIMGISIAFLSIGGIRLIKWISVIGFPFLLVFILSMIATSEPISLDGLWNLSFPAIVIVFSLVLSGMVNLPTFFRHSHSQADSFLALTLITVFTALFQVFSVCARMTEPSDFLTHVSTLLGMNTYMVFATAFILISLTCLNLVNIYYSSVALETMIPKLTGGKAYFLIGLMGTASYLFLQTSAPMLFMNKMANNFIANLGITLLLSFLMSIVVKHRPKIFEKSVSFICWSTGCVIALLFQVLHPTDPTVPLLGGFCGITIIFLCMLFFEQTTSAVKKLTEQKN